MCIYLGAAVGLGRCLSFRQFTIYWTDRYIAAAMISIVVLVLASFLALTRHKYAYAIGFLGTLFGWPFLLVFGFPDYTFSNPWIAFDIPTGAYNGAESDVLFAEMTILAIAFLLLAGAYSLLRLCPYSWRVGNLPVQERAWPSFVVTLFLMAVWYLSAASPWRVPIMDFHTVNWNARLCVLRVEKHGLQFHETSVAIRAGRNFHITRDDHRLFQYRFQEVHSDSAVPEEDFLRLQSMINVPPSPEPQLSHYSPPKAWNADRWFVYSQGRPVQNLFNVERSAIPPLILAWFYKAQGLEKSKIWQVTERDVCLGFCYDPTY
jgi:hypothetical protein